MIVAADPVLIFVGAAAAVVTAVLVIMALNRVLFDRSGEEGRVARGSAEHVANAGQDQVRGDPDHAQVDHQLRVD